MDLTTTPSATTLSTPYAPKAIFYEASDIVEYVREDITTVSRRIDGFLTLIYDMKSRDRLIGFKLKGFKNFYLKHLQKKQHFGDFLALVSVLETAFSEVGGSLFDKLDRDEAYRKAREIATDDGVRVDLPELQLAS